MKHEQNQWAHLSAPERIYHALVSLLLEFEYEDISITDICTRAGVSRMAYYRHYDSKHDILLRPVAARLDELFGLFEQGDLRDAGTYWLTFFRIMRRDELIRLILKAKLAQMMDVSLLRHAEQMCHAVYGWNMDTLEQKLHVNFTLAGAASLLSYAIFEDPAVSNETLADYIVEKMKPAE